MLLVFDTVDQEYECSSGCVEYTNALKQKSRSKIEAAFLARGIKEEPGDPRTRVKSLMAAAFALTRFVSTRCMGPGPKLTTPAKKTLTDGPVSVKLIAVDFAKLFCNSSKVAARAQVVTR